MAVGRALARMDLFVQLKADCRYEGSWADVALERAFPGMLPTLVQQHLVLADEDTRTRRALPWFCSKVFHLVIPESRFRLVDLGALVAVKLAVVCIAAGVR